MNLDEKDRKAEGQTDKKGEKPKCAMVYDKLLVLRGELGQKDTNTQSQEKYRDGQRK